MLRGGLHEIQFKIIQGFLFIYTGRYGLDYDTIINGNGR
jgi:hypothetical protein